MMSSSRLISCNRTGPNYSTRQKGKPIFLDYHQISEIRFGYHTITNCFQKKPVKKSNTLKGFNQTDTGSKPMDWTVSINTNKK